MSLGYLQLLNGYWIKELDQSGPYVFDGTSFRLVSAEASGGTPVVIADGADVTQGAVADAAVAAGAAGTLSAKLRRVSADLAALSAQVPATLGTHTSAASLSTTPASDAVFPVVVLDGADVTQGSVVDTVVAAGAAGTLSAKLRRLTTDMGALLGRIPAALGIQLAANSLSIAPASDAQFVLAPTSVRDYFIQVGFGLVAGHSRATGLGNNTNVSTGTVPEDIWGGDGLYPWPTAALSMELLSDNANDTAAGTGARTVTILGLDANYATLNQTVALNGTTPVAVPSAIFRINGFLVASAGSTESNVGTITLRVAGGGTSHAFILPALGFARRTMYTVPAGSTLQVVSMFFEIVNPSATDDATFTTYSRSSAGVRRLPADFTVTGSNPYRQDGLPGIVLGEKTDWTLRVTRVSSNSMSLTAGWLGVQKLNTAS